MKYTKNRIYIMGFILLIIDQISKLIALKFFKNEIVIINNFLSLDLSKNSGAAFGILADKRFFLLMITAAILIVISRLIRDEVSVVRLSFWSYALLVGGILGNFVDRLINGYVVDFVSFKLFGNQMPIFNLADTFIVFGAMLILWEFYKEYHENRSK